MNVIINLADKKSTIEQLNKLMEKEYVPFDIEITNSHIKDLNEKIGINLFSKNSLYISSITIHDIMQPIGDSGSHNYHGLFAEDIYLALKSINNPKYVYVTKHGRYAIVSIELSHFNVPLMLVIEKGAGIQNDINASVNKVITIYPKNYIDDYIAKLDKRLLLYENKNPQ